MAPRARGTFNQSLFILTLILFKNHTIRAEEVFKLSEMKHVGDHCESVSGFEDGGCNFLDEKTKTCQDHRCSCREGFMEVSFFGYLECVVLGGNPCVSSLWITRLMSKDEYKIIIQNLTKLDQRVELAVYDVYDAHIEASKDYARDKKPKDISCASGKCGDKDICAPGVNKLFIPKQGVNYGKIFGIVFGVIIGVVVFVLCAFVLIRYYNLRQGPLQFGMAARRWGFSAM